MLLILAGQKCLLFWKKLNLFTCVFSTVHMTHIQKAQKLYDNHPLTICDILKICN